MKLGDHIGVLKADLMPPQRWDRHFDRLIVAEMRKGRPVRAVFESGHGWVEIRGVDLVLSGWIGESAQDQE